MINKYKHTNTKSKTYITVYTCSRKLRRPLCQWKLLSKELYRACFIAAGLFLGFAFVRLAQFARISISEGNLSEFEYKYGVWFGNLSAKHWEQTEKLSCSSSQRRVHCWGDGGRTAYRLPLTTGNLFRIVETKSSFAQSTAVALVGEIGTVRYAVANHPGWYTGLEYNHRGLANVVRVGALNIDQAGCSGTFG